MKNPSNKSELGGIKKRIGIYQIHLHKMWGLFGYYYHAQVYDMYSFEVGNGQSFKLNKFEAIRRAIADIKQQREQRFINKYRNEK